MVNVFIVPQWFYGYDVIFELLFAIITSFVSYYAYKIYKLTNEPQSRLFSMSFLFFSISYFIQSLLNFGIFDYLNSKNISIYTLANISYLNAMGIYAQIIFFTLGLLTLIYMTLDLGDRRVYYLMLLISLPLLILSSNGLFLYYLLASILLAFIAIFYFKNYIKKKSKMSLVVFIAFDFLLFGQIHFLFAVNHSIYYVLGHFLELIAHLLILTSLLLILKNGKKTRKT